MTKLFLQLTAFMSIRNDPGTNLVQSEPPDPFQALFHPTSIALIGASESVGSVGRAVLENLRAFGSNVFPVNPKRIAVLGRHAYRTIGGVPREIDLAVIATPAESVPEVVQQCVDAKVRSAVILSAGFKECGAHGAELEQEVRAAARRGNLRLIGPNCLGLMMPHRNLNATFSAGMARPGHVAFLSQSGALCTAILDWSLRENVGFSGFVSLGSMLDVDWGDLIRFFGNDAQTKSIVCYMESVGDAHRFLAAASEVAFAKPILVLKVGRTEAAARAAASHTGALTGHDAVLDAAFRRVGVLRVNTLHELFDMAEVLDKQPRAHGPRLSIVTNAGGPGALATDALVTGGAQLAELGTETLQSLDRLLPPHWSRSNPIDILGDADAFRSREAYEIAIQDPGSDGLLAILTPQAMTNPEATAQQLCHLARQSTKPVLASWMGGNSVESARRLLNAAGIPTFDYPDTAARAFAWMWRHADQLRLLHEAREAGTARLDLGDAVTRVAAALKQARLAERTLLTEVESKQILAAYGIPTAETHVAFTEHDAVTWAEKLGYPVVVKLFSETHTHKATLGGVVLNVTTAEEVRKAWDRIHREVTAHVGAQHFLGVTIQPMVHQGSSELELVLGSSTDAQFGPVLMFGLGGHWVEALRDTTLGLPPLTPALAQRLMKRTRVFTALRGSANEAGANLTALSDILVRFSQLIVDQPRIAEVDINPLRVIGSEGFVALDARIVLHPPDVRDESLPRCALIGG